MRTARYAITTILASCARRRRNWMSHRAKEFAEPVTEMVSGVKTPPFLISRKLQSWKSKSERRKKHSPCARVPRRLTKAGAEARHQMKRIDILLRLVLCCVAISVLAGETARAQTAESPVVVFSEA